MICPRCGVSWDVFPPKEINGVKQKMLYCTKCFRVSYDPIEEILRLTDEAAGAYGDGDPSPYCDGGRLWRWRD